MCRSSTPARCQSICATRLAGEPAPVVEYVSLPGCRRASATRSPQRMEAQRRMNHQRQRLRRQYGDGCKSLYRVHGFLTIDSRHRHHGKARDQQRIAVGRRSRNEIFGNVARHAGPVLDDDRLPEGRLQLFADDARDRVDRRPRLIGDDQPYGSTWVRRCRFSARRNRQCRQRAITRRDKPSPSAPLRGPRRKRGHASCRSASIASISSGSSQGTSTG